MPEHSMPVHSSSSWFDSSHFMPHGHCYLWRPEVLWLNVISDALIAGAYMLIPVVLVLLMRRVDDTGAKWLIALFSIFISWCGITHMVSIWTVWNPDYYVQGIIKAITAGFSVATAMLCIPVALRILEKINAVNKDESDL